MKATRLRSMTAVLLLLALVGPAAALPQEQHGGAQQLQFKGEPVDLGADAARVGERIADLGYVDIAGASGSLAAAAGEHGLVVVIRDVFCPVSRRYGPRLGQLEKDYRARGFGFLYLDVNPADNLEVIADEIEAYGFAAPYVFAPDSPIARELEAMTSTEVFVLDAARILRYRGAVDDQYGIGFSKPAPTKNFLRDALDAVAVGDPVPVGGTIAPGCYLTLR